MAKAPYITSHRARVKKANEALKDWDEKVSLFDREAFVEFYLLEDIVRLYEHRIKKEELKVVETRAGKMSKERNLTKYAALIRIFKSAIEVAWGQIDSGNYKPVWKAIHEGALMSAAGNLKNLPEMRDLSVELLRELSKEAMSASREELALDEGLDDIEAHEANVARMTNIPTPSEIEEIIAEVERAIPDTKPNSRLNPKPNV